MVVASLTIAGSVGVVLSGAFLWREIGRFAAPQVPVTRFDERKLLAAYTVGLFAGVPLAVAYVLLVVSVGNGALPGAAVFVTCLVGGSELAQYLVGRTPYWAKGVALPFYVASFRAGVGGILALAAMASYLGAVVLPSVAGTAAALLSAVALVAVEVAGGLLTFRDLRPSASRVGGPLSGAVFGVVAFFLLALGPTAGTVGALVAPVIVLAGALLAYRGRRGVLAAVPSPLAAPGPEAGDRPLPYGRTAPPPEEEGGRGPGPE